MVILHAGAQGYLPSKISFLAHKFIRFNRSACACGKIGLLMSGIVFNYCARIACLSMAYGIEIVFFQRHKKTLQTHACKAKCRSGGKIYRAPIFPGNAKKSPANRSGRIPITYSILQKPFCGVLRPIFDTSPFRSALQ